VGDPGRRNTVDQNHLWDDDGREWMCKWAQWADCRTAQRFITGRRRPVAIHDHRNRVAWIQSAEAAVFWGRI
jgi:hypothetical protein